MTRYYHNGTVTADSLLRWIFSSPNPRKKIGQEKDEEEKSNGKTEPSNSSMAEKGTVKPVENGQSNAQPTTKKGGGFKPSATTRAMFSPSVRNAIKRYTPTGSNTSGPVYIHCLACKQSSRNKARGLCKRCYKLYYLHYLKK